MKHILGFWIQLLFLSESIAFCMLLLPCSPVTAITGDSTGICTTFLHFFSLFPFAAGFRMCFSRDLWWTGLVWLEANYPKGRHWSSSLSDDSACWIPTHPPPFIFRALPCGAWAREPGWGLCVCAGVSQGASLLLSPRKGKWQRGMGTGAASYRAMATSPDSALPPLVGRRRKRKEDKEVKLLRAARERREEGEWFVTGNFLCLLIMFSCLIKVGVIVLNLVLCTFPHLQMLGHCPANVKAYVNTISGCSSSLLLPQGIVTSIGV